MPHYLVGMATHHHGDFLTERDVAALLAISTKTLQRWRWLGGGPPYRKLGHAVRYRRADVEAWADSAARTSTSDRGAA